MKISLVFVFGIGLGVVWASQTYVPPLPPKLPEKLSKKMVESGKLLFEQNIFQEGPVQIYNFLGSTPCSTCHDKPNPLHPESLAKKFGTLPEIINQEIVKNSMGKILPLESPAMEALVQYLVDQYRLRDIKLSK